MEEEKFTLVLTNQQIEVIYRSLLEMPAKLSLPIIQELERQLRPAGELDKLAVKEKK